MASRREIAAARRRFRAAVRQQTRRAAGIHAEDKKFLIRALRRFEERIRAVATNSLITPETITSLRRQARNEIAALEDELSGGLRRALLNGAQHGQDAVLLPLQQVVPSVVPSIQGITAVVAGIAEQFSADLIGINSGGLAADVLRRVNNQLTLAVLGGSDQPTVVRNLMRIVRISLGRAQTIFRTEVGRMMSMATQATLENAGQKIPGLRKSWLWSGIERETHAQAEAQYGPGNGIAIDQPFIVDGEPLMFPRDATGSPGNTINCQCSEQPDMTDGALGEALDMAA